VLKKIFKAATAFTLLVGCYLGYAQVFALVVVQLTTVPRPEIVLQHRDSRSKQDSIKRAKAVMPSGHWATKNDLNFRYYNAERGYWMYAQDLEQVTEENGVRYDGKRIRLSPFLAISASHDGKKIYVITADRAIIDLNQPLGFGAGPDGETLKVKHIRLEPNVIVCDNKGTPNNLTDDMKIGPLRDLEYDDATRQITTESHVVIVDPDMVTSGDGMIVQLRRDDAPQPGAASGFGGAERLELLKNVEVVLHDVGKSGMMPGMKQPARPANGAIKAKIEVATAPGQSAKPELKQGPTPLRVTCKSKMLVFLPKPALPVSIGPPAPPAPTIVQFDRDVVVLRGQVDNQPGQLMCDSLKLTLVPGETVPDQSDTGEKDGLFGNLALQRAHATGHAVWLYLPADGIKLRCNELIHMHLVPYKPNWTYFRADLTQKLWLEKIDLVQDVDSPDRGKIKSVTHIWTVDATMYDKGNGFDSADVVANGPGRLETRPDRGQATERIAIWQDKLELQNELAPDGKIKQKIIVLTGKRPCIDDRARSASIDSAKSIKVLLVPKIVQATQDDSVGGGGFDIKRVLAFRDVHLLAPAKTMTARNWLDADFVQVAPPPPAGEDVLPPPPAIAAAPTANTEDVSGALPTNLAPADEQFAAKNEPPKKPDESPMVGSAERIWVKVEMKPKSLAPPATDNQTEPTKTASTTKSKTSSQDGDLGDKTSEIREAWLWGSVALHQEPAKGKTIGQEASGEALYLDNQGEGKAITWIYQRDPNETTYLPGPLPPARAANDDKIITGAGFIAMNQGTDQAWVSGPGTLTQFTTRSASSPADSKGAAPRTASTSASRTTIAPSAAEPHATSLLAQTDTTSSPAGRPPEYKPTTRAGRPLSEKVASTICFSEGMEFNGRSVDPAGHPAGRTDFLGIVTAQLEDSLLYCEERMIAYTDRIVPLAKLGALSKSDPAGSGKAGGQPGDGRDADDQPQLALIECYKNAVGISRKVHPNVAAVLQRQEIQADELLVYERLTGEFHVPGKGKVFLYDRSDNSGGPGLAPNDDTASRPTAAERPVTPASNRASASATRSSSASKAKSRATSRSQSLNVSADSKTSQLPPLVLTQIHFLKGMRGRLASTGERSQVEPNWYNFFGDIELGRAKVETATSQLNFDKLPADGMFLTGQTLSVRTEPPPVASPSSTPARDYVKAWENAYVSSSDKRLQADVITYDSEKDLIYAFGQGGRGVIYAQQHAAGQPATEGLARAVELHPKTGAAHFIDNTSVQFVDKNSGARPTPATPTDPDFKKKKPPKKGFRISPGSVERRGFTGQ
jgi:hypothetical protein